MADDERDEPSLELPSLGLGRRRRRAGRDRHPEPAPPAGSARSTATASLPVVPPGDAPAGTSTGTSAGTSAGTPAEAEAAGPRRRARRARRERPVRAAGSTGGAAAVLVAGLLVGALTVGLTWLAQRGCEWVRGTSSCGEPGLLVLLAIVVVAGLAGTAVLRLARVPAPGSTSALGVGLLVVVALLFLGGSLFEAWAAAAVPLLAALTFALAHGVTTRVGEEPGDAG